MRKFTFLLACALLSSIATQAQLVSQRLNEKAARSPQMAWAARQGSKARLSDIAAKAAQSPAKAARRLPVVSEDVVWDASGLGEYRDNMGLASFGFIPFYGYLMNHYNHAAISNYVLAEDSTIWLYNPITTIDGGYLKLEKTADGTYVCHTPQAIYSDDWYDDGETLYATRLTLQDHGQGAFYYPDSVAPGTYDTDIFFTFEDGVIRQVNDALDDSTGAPMEIIAITDADGGWYGYGESQLVVRPITETPTTLPDGLATTPYILTDSIINDTTGLRTLRTKMVRVAVDGDTVYMSDQMDAGYWVKGVKAADSSLVFRSQYLGTNIDYNSHMWFKPATFEVTYDDAYEDPYYVVYALADSLRLVPVEGGYASQAPSAMLINGGDDDVFFADARDLPGLKVFQEVPATPQNPYFTWFSPFDEDYQWGFFSFVLSPYDADGNFLNTDKLSYQVFLEDDEEPFVFYPDEYMGISEPMTEVPYSFTDMIDFFIYEGEHTVYYYIDTPYRIGVEAIYRGGGEERRSQRVYFNYAETDGIKAPNGGQDGQAEWFDLQGRPLNAPQHGLNIMRKADGTVRKVMVK